MAKKHQEESKYTREELIRNARAVFKVAPEAVVGALHENSKTELTISETKKAVEDFMKKKVK